MVEDRMGLPLRLEDVDGDGGVLFKKTGDGGLFVVVPGQGLQLSAQDAGALCRWLTVNYAEASNVNPS